MRLIMTSKHTLLVLFMIACTASAAANDFGTFNGELVYKAVPGEDRVVQTVVPFGFADAKGKLWTVPAGSKVDGASIPQAFWSLIGGPFTGKYREASVVHDHYCKTKTETWQDTHRVFYDGMRANGVAESLAATMYGAVYFRGPRWILTKSKDGLVSSVSGTPLPLRDIKINIVELASRPNITLEEVRGAIDKALEIADERTTVQTLAKQDDCSLVVEPLDSNATAFAICELDVEEKRILAARNLRILISDVETLLSANKSLLIPRINNYVKDPTTENWNLVDQASRRVLKLVNMTLISLNQYRSGLNQLEQRLELTDYSPEEYLKSIGIVERIAKTRGAMLKQNIRNVPVDPNGMRRWKLVYVELLKRLRKELPALSKGLE